MKKKMFFSLLGLLVVFGLVATSVQPGQASNRQTYLVVFDQEVDLDEAVSRLGRAGFSASGTFRHALKGAVIQATPEEVVLLMGEEGVKIVEPNQIYSIQEQTMPTGLDRVFASGNAQIEIDSVDDYRVNVDVAVIDTGVDFDHPDLNVYSTINCTWSGPKEGTCAGTKDDGSGHGTHVSGTIGALDNDFGVVGIAPGARIWGVKVLNNYGIGTTAQIVAGIDYVALHADEIEVANMSLGGVGESEVMDLAISNAVEAGVTFVLAAGNNKMDVNNYHPAGNPDAITVSALADFDGLPGGLGEPTCKDDIDDTLADFSNYGEGVTIAAPGVCIYSTYLNGLYTVKSGTSMAAPHVAGAAAIIASQGDYTSVEIKDILTANGNYNWIDESPDGILEPLLDLSSEAVFDPVMIDMLADPIVLDGYGYFVSGEQVSDLVWSGTTVPEVDLYRDGVLLETTPNDGEYIDYTGIKGRGFHNYIVCEAGAQTRCSNVLTVTF